MTFPNIYHPGMTFPYMYPILGGIIPVKWLGSPLLINLLSGMTFTYNILEIDDLVGTFESNIQIINALDGMTFPNIYLILGGIISS